MPIHLVIHGHFYQPPRENPWTGEIDRQESAAPYHDWNARILAECYGSNARSRVLDAGGRILDIVNTDQRLWGRDGDFNEPDETRAAEARAIGGVCRPASLHRSPERRVRRMGVGSQL